MSLAAAEPSARHRWWTSRRLGAAQLGGVVATSSLLTVLIARPWTVPLRVPYTYTGDGLTQASVVKGIIETGWYAVNPRLGAPDGFHAYDFPLGGDNLHYLAVKVLTWFSHDPFLVTNLYFLASFVLVAVAAYLVLRRLGVSAVAAHAGALVYTLLPYHFLRGTAHMVLGAYYSVPLGCLLVLLALGGELPATVAELRSRRVVAPLLCCLVVGAAGTYYAVFTVALLAVAGLLRALAARRLRDLVAAAGASAVVGVTILVNQFPSLRYVAAHGKNPGAVIRQVWEGDAFALRPIQLLTPVPGHRLAFLAHLSRTLLRAPSNSEPTQFLGAIGVTGLALALYALVARSMPSAERRRPLVDPHLGVVAVAGVLLGVSGGLSWLLAIVGGQDIRAWGRVSVFLAFVAVVAVTQALDRGLALAANRWRGPQRWRGVGAPAVAAIVLVAVAFADQVPASLLPDSRPNRTDFFSDEAFVLRVEAANRRSDLVFQLPWASYPEAPMVGRLPVDNLLRPYLHSTHLRWSFGGMRGRDGDWMEAAVAQPVPSLVDTLAAVGYTGITIDRLGYGDGAADLLGQLAAAGAPQRFESGTGRLVYVDLVPARAALERRLGQAGGSVDAAVKALAAAAVNRPYLWWDSGFYFEERTADEVRHSATANARSELVNRAKATWRGVLRFEASAPGGQGTLTVAVAGGASRTLPVGPAWTPVELPVALAPGRTTVTWRTDAPAVQQPGDPRDVHLAVRAVAVADG